MEFISWTMSKKIIMSLLSTAAISIGGWMVSCGSEPSEGTPSAVLVQLPEGCTLVSPRDPLSALNPALPMAQVKPGPNQFVVTCEGRMIQVDKQIAPDQRTVAITAEDVR